MLQNLRDNLKGGVAIFIVVILVIPFALVGIEELAGVGKVSGAASVNGEVVNDAKISTFIAYERQRLQQLYGENLPQDFVSDERLRPSAIDNIVSRLVFVQSAVEGGMAISEQKVNSYIANMPAFQVDGVFNEQAYRRILFNNANTPAKFKEEIADDLILGQHSRGIMSSSFMTAADVASFIALVEQKRTFDYVTFSKSEVLDSIVVTEQDIETSYNDNQARHMSQEQVSVNYIELKPELFAGEIVVGEEDILAHYEDEIADFEANTERNIAHILLEERDDRDSQVLAQEIIAKLNAGEEFSALASEYSDDLFSAESGGDLGFSKGETFDANIEAVIVDMEIGSISEPIETDQGLHIVKLLDVNKLEAPSLEERRAAIESILKTAAAADQQVEMVDTLADLMAETSDLATIAESLGVELKQSELFSRNGGPGIAAHNAVIEAAFEEGVLLGEDISEMLEISDEHVAVVALNEHKPSAVKPLDEVKETIRSMLTEERARQQISEQGEVLLSSTKASGELIAPEGEEVSKVEDLKRSDRTVGFDLIEHVFALPKPSGSPVVSGVQLGNGDYVVVTLKHVVDGSVSSLEPDMLSVLTEQLTRTAVSADSQAYQAYIKEMAEIDIH